MSDLAKISGYSYSSSFIDALIDRVEAHVAAYRSQTSSQLSPSASFGAPPAPFATATAARPFDFAFLSELTNSAENSPDATHPLAAASTPSAHVPMQGLSTSAVAASLDPQMAPSAPFGLGGLEPGTFDPTAAFGTQAMPTFSPEQLAQLLGAGAGGEGQGDVGAADAFAGWAAW